mmetsp:Transcript_37172/g.68318  ORF Transcript_37172/g.68318 Transcript_37172/m.68318 type:complete len:143 (-) Transcript_37172:483-911(-)
MMTTTKEFFATRIWINVICDSFSFLHHHGRNKQIIEVQSVKVLYSSPVFSRILTVVVAVSKINIRRRMPLIALFYHDHIPRIGCCYFNAIYVCTTPAQKNAIDEAATLSAMGGATFFANSNRSFGGMYLPVNCLLFEKLGLL